MSRAQSAGLSLTKSRQAIPVLDDRDVIAPNPPTQVDVASQCFADTEHAVELTNRGRTFLALDTAAEVGAMQQCWLWQSKGASEWAFRLWAETRCIPLQFVEAHGGGSVDVLRIASDTVDVTFFYDGAK